MIRSSAISISILAWGLAAITGGVTPARASDVELRAVGVVDRQGITIIGDQELPTVLYIVPWKLPRPPEAEPPPVTAPSLVPLTPCRLRSSEASDETAPLWPCASAPASATASSRH